MALTKVLIAGSRTINLQSPTVSDLLEQLGWSWNSREFMMVIEGGAKGIDDAAHRFAVNYDIPHKQYPAEWDKQGKRAGYVRNEKMVREADEALIVWDGKSPGTKNTLELVRQKGIPYCLVTIEVHNVTRRTRPTDRSEGSSTDQTGKGRIRSLEPRGAKASGSSPLHRTRKPVTTTGWRN